MTLQDIADGRVQALAYAKYVVMLVATTLQQRRVRTTMQANGKKTDAGTTAGSTQKLSRRAIRLMTVIGLLDLVSYLLHCVGETQSFCFCLEAFKRMALWRNVSFAGIFGRWCCLLRCRLHVLRRGYSLGGICRLVPNVHSAAHPPGLEAEAEPRPSGSGVHCSPRCCNTCYHMHQRVIMHQVLFNSVYCSLHETPFPSVCPAVPVLLEATDLNA